jgi:hypothetical protein
MRPPLFIRLRAKACSECPTRCGSDTDSARADPRDACPLPEPAWTRWGRGDAVAGFIERNILAPVEKAVPAAAPAVAAVRRCGGCKSDIARMNGDGTRSSPI